MDGWMDVYIRVCVGILLHYSYNYICVYVYVYIYIYLT